MKIIGSLLVVAALGLVVASAPGCDAEITSSDRVTGTPTDAAVGGRDASSQVGRDATSEGGPDVTSDAGRVPFTPAAGCMVPPDGGARDAAVHDSGADATVDAGLGCVNCQPAYVTRWVGSGVTVTDEYPACCAQGQGTQTCGVVIGGQCYSRQEAGTLALACPQRCCRMDGMCGIRTTSPAIGCFASMDPQPATCRAAAAPHPGACACASCSAEIAKCAGSSSCASVVACRAGRATEQPADPEGYALADALDACLERAGCGRLPEVGICREACPSGSAGGGLVHVDLNGCCRADGLCGVKDQTNCILYDDPPLNGAPRTLSGPPPTCHAAMLAHPDQCACDSCKAAMLECARDPRCVAISECRVETGCRGAACDSSTACSAVILANGGSQGMAAVGARAVESCLETARCQTRQFGVCK